MDTALLHDQNGDAIVVELKNESKQTLVNVPILVDITDAKGNTVYKNNTAGLDFALNHMALLKPGETFYLGQRPGRRPGQEGEGDRRPAGGQGPAGQAARRTSR